MSERKEIPKGSYAPITIRLFGPDGKAEDLSTVQAIWVFVQYSTGDLLRRFTDQGTQDYGNVSIVSASDGDLKVELFPSDTKDEKEGDLYAEVKYTDQNGNKWTVPAKFVAHLVGSSTAQK